MRSLSISELNYISGGMDDMGPTVIYEGYDYDLTDLIDDVSTMGLIGIGLNVYLEGSFDPNTVFDGGALGAIVGATYGFFNYIGYRAFGH